MDDRAPEDRAASTPPAEVARLSEEVGAALDAYLDEALARLVALDAALAPLADELRAFTATGKRLRPVLLLLGHRAGGGTVEDVMGPALALELLHTGALLHDDLVDDATTRRGRPATHLAFADQHAAAGWSGSSRAHGEAVAILLGDLAFALADDAFLTARVPADHLLTALRRFTLLREEVMAGQYLDMLVATTRSRSRDDALRVATLKSGRYSVARPLEVGALLAGADEDLVAGLHRFGDPLGRAFQVRDDLLGVFGDPATTGKSSDGDLREGKRTLLVAETLARLGPEDVARFEDALGDPDLDGAGADGLRQLMRTSGARRATDAYVTTAVGEARAQLDALAGHLPADVAATLHALAGWLGDRAT